MVLDRGCLSDFVSWVLFLCTGGALSDLKRMLGWGCHCQESGKEARRSRVCVSGWRWEMPNRVVRSVGVPGRGGPGRERSGLCIVQVEGEGDHVSVVHSWPLQGV